jgi:hypothetical protein
MVAWNAPPGEHQLYPVIQFLPGPKPSPEASLLPAGT